MLAADCCAGGDIRNAAGQQTVSINPCCRRQLFGEAQSRRTVAAVDVQAAQNSHAMESRVECMRERDDVAALRWRVA